MKDEIISWFLRNVLLSKIEIIEEAGYILMSSPFRKDLKFREIATGEMGEK